MRLLPLIGGMLVGMVASGRLTEAAKLPDGGRGEPRVSAKLAVTAGFLVMAAGLAIGALHRARLLDRLRGALGHLDRARPRPRDAVRDERRGRVRLTAERSASGGALMSAVRQVGATIGVAVLGTLISNGYTSQLHLDGLPSAAASAVRSSVAGGVEVAQRLGSPALLDMVRSAFIHGMDIMLWTCGGIAVVSALLALAFLPRRSAPAQDAPAEPADSARPAEAQLRT